MGPSAHLLLALLGAPLCPTLGHGATSEPSLEVVGTLFRVTMPDGRVLTSPELTGAVLDVTSQNDTGIGGDLFALVYVAKDKKLYALNSAGWAPAGWTPDFFKIPKSGW